MIGVNRLHPRDTPAMAVIADMLEARTGQQIGANRQWRFEAALNSLMRDRGLATFEALVAVLEGGHDSELADTVVDKLLNQETSFFRDPGVIESVVAAIEAMRSPARTDRFRVWSAACATGQEPLSLSLLLAENDAQFPFDDPEIVATDISERAIARARRGRFTQFEIQRGLRARQMIDWFRADGNDWVADHRLLTRIRFGCHNLVADTPPPGWFDIILCRNVLLYLSSELRSKVLSKLTRALRPGGLLVLGAGETVIGYSDALVPSLRFRGFYERTADRAANPSILD